MPELIRFENISKSFGSTQANQSVSFSIDAGTVHGIVGENGAGKSTIMKILYGMYPFDEGRILYNGREANIKSPHDAISLGLGMVHQHFMLVPTLSVLENVILGSEPTALVIDKAQVEKDLSSLQKEFGFSLNLGATVEELPVGQQQQVEILKLLYRKADTLILDEPTAVLTPQEVDLLFEKLSFLNRQGKTIIIITHKLKEIIKWTSRVTIMRHGRVIETTDTKSLNEHSLAEKIIGRKQKPLPKASPQVSTEPVLEIKDLQDGKKLQKLSFRLEKGEIVGLAGIDGNGQSELVHILAGVRIPSSGEILFKGKTLTPGRKPPFAIIPPDRHQEGAVLEFTMAENTIFGLHDNPEFGKHGWLSRRKMDQFAKKLLSRFDVRPSIPSQGFSTFSGGNQQKMVVGRESEKMSDCLIACHPTRGVDIGAIEFIHEHLIGLRNQGVAILLVSSELDEILALSDRIIVINQGRIVGERKSSEANERELGLWMAGEGA